MTTDRMSALEDRITALEDSSQAAAASALETPTPSDANFGDLSIQAFLQGALAAAATGVAATPAASTTPGTPGAAFFSLFGCETVPQRGDGGETAVRAFWWGFHVQLSHQDLTTVLDSADTINDLVAAIGGNIPSPAAPWIKLIAPFVSATHDALRSLDRGRGIYISMSWITPGIFIPTIVT